MRFQPVGGITEREREVQGEGEGVKIQTFNMGGGITVSCKSPKMTFKSLLMSFKIISMTSDYVKNPFKINITHSFIY